MESVCGASAGAGGHLSCLGDIKKLLRHISPTRTRGQRHFGCEDPAVTGSILAALGMSIPLHKNCIQITPLFEGGNHLEGYVKVKGRFYGVMLLKTALEIYLNKNIKYVITDGDIRRPRNGKRK